MRFPHQSLPRDWLILLAWGATTVCLALLAGIGELGRRLEPTGGRLMAWLRRRADTRKLARLDGMLERSVWQCEMAAAKQTNVADALELAEEAFEQVRAECAAVMALPPRLVAEHAWPAAEPMAA
jgi:hypothetical protein